MALPKISLQGNLPGRVMNAIPSATSIGNSIGTIAGSKIKQQALGLGSKLLPGLFNNKYLGPLAQGVWGSLFYSQSDLVTQMEKRGDPLLVIDWSIVLPFAEDGYDEINSYVEEISFQTTAIDTTPVVRGGRTINMPSGQTTPNFTMTFFADSRECYAERYLDYWKQNVRNPNGTFNYPYQYKKMVMVHSVAPTGEYVGTHLLANCFPAGSVTYDNSSGSSDRIRIQQDFTCEAHAWVGAGKATVGSLQKA